MKINLLNLYALASAPVVVCYDNDNDAFIPELWAQESLVILEESMVMCNLVHRDFENQVQQFGDVVNTRRPSKFKSKRKVDSDEVTAQDAQSQNVQVPLDQHHYNTFVIKDGEASKSFQELVKVYLRPCIQAVGRGVDRSIAGQVHRFIGGPDDRVGGLNKLTSSNARDYVVDARQILNMNNVPEDEFRHLVLSPAAESAFLKTDLLVKANESGSTGALRRAQLGQLFGFDVYAARNTPYITDSMADVATGTVTGAKSAGAAAAATPVTISTHEASIGEWMVIDGNDQPQYITAVTAATGSTTSVTPNEASKNASSAGATIKVYKKVLAAGDYAVGYSKEILVDGWTNAPSAGQMLAVGTGASRKVYTIIESNLSSAGVQEILLDRPLETAIADNDSLFPGPSGSFNLAFHRNALAFVNRPLARPNSGLGVMSALANYNGLSIRICMQYDSKAQGTRVTADLLSGVALLDADMACLILG